LYSERYCCAATECASVIPHTVTGAPSTFHCVGEGGTDQTMNGQTVTCHGGVWSTPTCLSSGGHPNDTTTCCGDFIKKTDYYQGLTNNFYTCCAPSQCARDSQCVNSGTTIPGQNTATPLATCNSDGYWERTPGTACLSEGQYSANVDTAQCCVSPASGSLQLKHDYYSGTAGSNYPGYTCCYTGECAYAGTCVANNSYATGTHNRCENGNWNMAVTY